MSDTMQLKSHLLKLAPFFCAVVLYFVFVRDPQGELWTTVLKCLPIVMLMLYIMLNGFALMPNYRYAQCILLGLISSCVGDALLNVDLFPYGMGAFGVAHIWYISAFGWKPLMLGIGVPLYILGALLVSVMYKHLDAVLAVGLPIYTVLLLTTCWRAIAREIQRTNSVSIFCAVGTALFVISDALIAVDMFLIPVPHQRILIMTTYYIAQLAIALSTANERPQTYKHLGNGQLDSRGQSVKNKD